MPTPSIKNYDAATHSKLLDWRREAGLNNRQIGAQLGVSESVVSRYVNGRPSGNVEQFEASIEDTILNAANIPAGDGHFETAITRQIHNVIAKTRQVCGISLINAPAGMGKTTALEMYKEKRPNCILISADVQRRNPRGLEQLIWPQIDDSKWSRQCSRWEYILDRFKGTNRPIIIDEAHELTALGRKWPFHFHRITGCPVILSGNPEILEDIRNGRAAPQQLRRIIHCATIGWTDNRQIYSAIDTILEQRVPRKWHSDTLRQQAFLTAKNTGFLGALDTRISVAELLMKSGEMRRFSDAFIAAHKDMIETCALPS